MPYDPEDDDEQPDGATSAFVYGGGGQDGQQQGRGMSGYDPSNPNKGLSPSDPLYIPAVANPNGARPAPSAAPNTTPPLPVVTSAPLSSSNGNDDDALHARTYNPTPLPPMPASRYADEQRLETQLATPPPNRADYKPSIGRRIGGSIAAALVGMGTHNAEQGLQVGESAIDAPWDRAQEAYRQKQAQTQQQLNAVREGEDLEGREWERGLQQHNAGESDYNTSERAYQGQVMARDRAAQEKQRLQGVAPGTEQPDDPQNKMGGWHATTVGGQAIKLNGPPDSWLKTPEGKAASQAASGDALIRNLKANGTQLTPEDEKYIRVNGKLREPSPTTTIHNEPAGKAEWDAYVKSLGHDPTTQEVINFKRNAPGGGSTANKNLLDRIESQKNTAISKARQQYGQGKDPSYTLDDYLDDWQAAQDNYEDRLGTTTGQNIPHTEVRDHVDSKGVWKTDGKGGAAPAPQPSAAAPAPRASGPPAGSVVSTPSGKQVKIGDPVIVGGQRYTVTGYNPRSGKPIIQPAQQPSGAQ
ncbi:MAG TPA: hypothetical protein VGG42_09785 [Acidobacteriaceae bacterium]|jgi:hypothetical protein